MAYKLEMCAEAKIHPMFHS